MENENYFSSRSAAARYAKGRPHFHSLIAGRIKEFLSLDEPLSRALDVGCGTGLSAVALKDIAREIVGLDASPEMIALAPADDQISYVVSIAEQLPFDTNAFDLVSVSQAIHWFDRQKFFAEASRVLRSNAWLVIYDNSFSGQAEESDDFQSWHRESYLLRFPSPHRPWTAVTAEEVDRQGFHLTRHQEHQHIMVFSLESLIDYLVTQSNVIAAVEGGCEDLAEVRLWIGETIAPLFGNTSVARLMFDMPIWYLQRAR